MDKQSIYSYPVFYEGVNANLHELHWHPGWGGGVYPKYSGNILTFGYKTPPGMVLKPRKSHGISTTNLSWFSRRIFLPSTISWLVVSTHLKKIVQNGFIFPKIVKIKNIWNHHLVSQRYCQQKQAETPRAHLFPQKVLPVVVAPELPLPRWGKPFFIGWRDGMGCEIPDATNGTWNI